VYEKKAVIQSLDYGTEYLFYVQALTEYGLSEPSAELRLLAASKPLQASAPTTVVNGANVEISWTAPNDQGSPLIGYRVFIRKNDSKFNQELGDCDVSSTPEALSCSVALTALIVSPYNLVKDASVYAKVQALNFYGDGPISTAGNGAKIVLVPDTPV